MKRQFGIVAFAAAALVCGLAFSQNPPAQDPLPTRVEKLEKELAASRLRVEVLTAEIADLKKAVTAAVAYAANQSKSAAAMATALDESERMGFTYGINPDSRHILLRGWREQLAAAQKDVPVVEVPVVPTPAKPVEKPADKPTDKTDAKPDTKSPKMPVKTGT